MHVNATLWSFEMNYKLTLCYDGSRYKGWQKQKSTDNTIQGKIETVLGRILDQPIEIIGCGRTDAGVHAKEQVCSFRADTVMSCYEILDNLRKYLPEDIGVVSLETADERFHARLSCKEKTYIYRIHNSVNPNVFERKYVYMHPEKLDIEKMRQASELLEGRHDFAPFSSVKNVKKSTVRNVTKIDINSTDDLITISFTGDGFLYNMVRIMVGTLIEVGECKRKPESIYFIFSSKKRENAGFTAPANGLFLWNIKY